MCFITWASIENVAVFMKHLFLRFINTDHMKNGLRILKRLIIKAIFWANTHVK